MYEKLHDKATARPTTDVKKESGPSSNTSQPLIQDVNHSEPNVYPRSTSMPNMGSQAGGASKLNVPWRINSSEITPVPENEELDILASQAPSQETSDIELQLQER